MLVAKEERFSSVEQKFMSGFTYNLLEFSSFQFVQIKEKKSRVLSRILPNKPNQNMNPAPTHSVYGRIVMK